MPETLRHRAERDSSGRLQGMVTMDAAGKVVARTKASGRNPFTGLIEEMITETAGNPEGAVITPIGAPAPIEHVPAPPSLWRQDAPLGELSAFGKSEEPNMVDQMFAAARALANG